LDRSDDVVLGKLQQELAKLHRTRLCPVGGDRLPLLDRADGRALEGGSGRAPPGGRRGEDERAHPDGIPRAGTDPAPRRIAAKKGDAFERRAGRGSAHSWRRLRMSRHRETQIERQPRKTRTSFLSARWDGGPPRRLSKTVAAAFSD